MRLKMNCLVYAVMFVVVGCDRQLSFDAQGIAHGSGERTYSYKSGAAQLRENYVDGKLVRSRWFKPDGTLIQETNWTNGNGEGIYLREDGSVRTRMRYVNGVAEGEAKQYDEAGHVTKIEQYHAGECISESEPPATRPAS